MEEIRKLLAETEKMIDAKREFEFWHLLERGERLAEKIEKQILGQVEDGASVKGRLILGKNSVVKAGTRIEGNCFVGENCTIGPFAYLRNCAIIGDSCHIGSSEVKNSIILSHSKIPHYSYVGDSIIGQNVNFGAGTKIANLRFDNENVKVSINGRNVDSGRRKLGALVGHNTKTGINSSINCGIIVGKNCFILPGRVAEKNMGNGEKLR